jgi:ABC-2 type transport system permease protein
MTVTISTTPPVAATPLARRGASFVPAAYAVGLRTTRKFLRSPQLVVMGTAQGALFLLIFRYVFAGALTIPGGLSYVNFLIPGFVTTGILFSGMTTSSGMAEDIEGGFFDRLRSLPIPRTSAMWGRAIADSLLLVWSLIIMTGIGFAVGFRLHASLADALGAFGLAALFGFAFTWLFIVIGLIAGNAQAAQGFSLLVFPLTFISSAYVPVGSMPGWMQAIANHQPITYMVDAVRALTEGHPATHVLGHSASYYVVTSIGWSALLVAVFAPLAVLRYRRG